MTRTPQISVLSFFTGAGFLDIGFKNEGFTPVWHNEYYVPFADGFEYGMKKLYARPPEYINRDSIEMLSPDDILRQAFGTRARPNVFGVIGGPPCPDFSVGGRNEGFDGPTGRLSWNFASKIKVLKPAFFVFENVPGMVRTLKHRLVFQKLVDHLDTEYRVDVKLLNALDYGVPQDRQRLIMVGVSRSWLRKVGDPSAHAPKYQWGNESWFPFPEAPEQFRNAKQRYKWPTCSEFGGQPDLPDESIPLELMVHTHLLQDEQTLYALENSADFFKPYSKKFYTVPEGDDRKRSFKRLHRYRYSPTAAYGNNEVHLHPTKARRLSVREAMRIQSVPDEYALPAEMSLTDKFKTVGNGVPVRLAEIVARGMMLYLQQRM